MNPNVRARSKRACCAFPMRCQAAIGFEVGTALPLDRGRISVDVVRWMNRGSEGVGRWVETAGQDRVLAG